MTQSVWFKKIICYIYKIIRFESGSIVEIYPVCVIIKLTLSISSIGEKISLESVKKSKYPGSFFIRRFMKNDPPNSFKSPKTWQEPGKNQKTPT